MKRYENCNGIIRYFGICNALLNVHYVFDRVIT